jgi:hypothetical protein
MSESEIPGYDFELAEGKPLTKFYNNRVQKNQDIFCIVDDRHHRRGTGKSTLSIGLAAAMDRTDEGLTKDKVSLDPDELIEAYTSQPKGSALILDEAEASVSKYRAGSSTNKAIRDLVSQARVREKYVVMNLPNSGSMDRDLKTLASLWVMVEERGRATVHFLGYEPYGEHPLTPKKQTLNWTEINDPDLKDIYEYLADQKNQRLEGEDIGEVVSESELEQIKERAATEERNQLLQEFYESDCIDCTQHDLADTVGLSRSRVADILR